MPRVTLAQNDFTAGELDPRLYGRSDIEKYRSAAETITNGLVLPYGGVKKRPGTVHVAATKHADRAVRLVRYVFNRDQAYCLEFGHLYIRFFTDSGQVESGGVAYEIESPYSESELDDLSFAQTGDVLFIAHGSHQVRRLTRYAHDSWTLSIVQFTQIPCIEQDWRPPYRLTLSSATVGAGRTATAPVFAYTDFSASQQQTRRIFSVGGGEAYISAASTAQNSKTITIVKPFESGTIEPDDWWITGSPQCDCRVYDSAFGYIALTSLYVGAPVILAPGSASFYNATVGADVVISTISATTYNGKDAALVGIPAHGLSDGVMIRATDNATGATYVFQVTGSSTNAFYIVTANYPNLDVTTLDKINLLTNANTNNYAFRAHDVGSIWQAGGGYIQITDVTSPANAAGIITKLPNSVLLSKNTWSIMRPCWSDDFGYPRAVTIYEQRLVFAGSEKFPNTVWMSRIGDFLDFGTDTSDDGPVSINISADEMADIRHLSQAKALIALSSTGEFTFVGGVEKPITPTNVQVKNQSAYGCSGVRPQRVGNELYFVQRSGKKLRAMAYKYDSDAYGSPDLSVLSGHICDLGVVDMAYQPEPYSVLWCAMADGSLGALTIERDQNVAAWSSHETDGDFENVCSIPSSGTDRLWCVVRRTVDGADYRSVCYMSDSIYLDSAVSGSEVSATDTWSGLDHLEGLSVGVVADGVYNGDYTVSGGSITLNRTANTVTIGLKYTMTLKPMTPELMTGEGSAAGNSMRVSEVTLRLHESIGCKVNGDNMSFVSFGDVLDEAPASFTGLKRIEKLGWGRGECDVTITSADPYPLHVLAVIYKFTVNS